MKGICFKEPLFHKTVKREKTQTRRIINPQPIADIENLMFYGEQVFRSRNNDDDFVFIKHKYKVGEVVYLKEPYILYQEDYPELKSSQSGIQYAYKFGSNLSIEEITEDEKAKWRNKLFMPASAARHFIKITAVRAERLQDISEEDCLKEGIEIKSDAKVIGYPFGVKFPYNNGYGNYSTAREAYAALIDQINGKGTWERNPFVWVYDYQKINIR